MDHARGSPLPSGYVAAFGPPLTESCFPGNAAHSNLQFDVSNYLLIGPLGFIEKNDISPDHPVGLQLVPASLTQAPVPANPRGAHGS